MATRPRRLYFVTPTTRNRPAKVEALGDFLAERLSRRRWEDGSA
ncbi:hypothetical protein [Teichococcus deserti]|nr:hypothetical protein [Pseudoroseomonas deserti]